MMDSADGIGDADEQLVDFVHFFAADDTPSKVTALDAKGNVVSEWSHDPARASVKGA